MFGLSEATTRAWIERGVVDKHEGPWRRTFCLGQRSIEGRPLWGPAWRRGTWAVTRHGWQLHRPPAFYDYASTTEVIRLRVRGK